MILFEGSDVCVRIGWMRKAISAILGPLDELLVWRWFGRICLNPLGKEQEHSLLSLTPPSVAVGQVL